MYAISRQRIEQLQSSFGFVSTLFPTNVAGRHVHQNHENPQARCQKPWMYKLLLCNTTANNLQNNKKTGSLLLKLHVNGFC